MRPPGLLGVPPSRLARAVDAVARERGVNPVDIRRPCRKPAVVSARWEVWRRVVKPETSICALARAWPCDPTTIRHALVQGENSYIRRRST